MYFSHMTFLISHVIFSNKHVDSLFACHIVDLKGDSSKPRDARLMSQYDSKELKENYVLRLMSQYDSKELKENYVLCC